MTIMFFFRVIYPNFGLKGSKASPKEAVALCSQNESGAPTKKPVCVMHPENAPRMIGDNSFPKDFQLFEYAGATLEMFSAICPNGNTVRRPALVAKMIHRCKVDRENAFIEVEMTASLSDLRAGEHPNAEAIGAALKMFYEEKVPVKERAVRKQKAGLPKTISAAAPATQI